MGHFQALFPVRTFRGHTAVSPAGLRNSLRNHPQPGTRQPVWAARLSVIRICEMVKMKYPEKPFKLVSLSSTAILLWDSQPLAHVQPVRIHLDPSERSLPAPLSTGTVRPRVSHHPASFSFRPGVRGEMCPKPILQLQPVWPAHEPWHMELRLQPQLQLAALQRLRLLRRCLKTAALKHKCKHIKQCYVKRK